MAQQHNVEFASRVLQDIAKERESGRVPVVVLDLDLTLLDNRPRTRAILRDFIHAHVEDVRMRATALERLEGHSIVYSIQENMKAIGIEAENFRQDGLSFWMDRFFADRFCAFDTPYAGAAEACVRMVDDGAHVVYLTGRYQDTQAVGTVQSLRQYGFPIGQLRTQLVMKTSRSESDMAYKRRVAEELIRLGTPVAAVDNEPGHCNTMRELFPDASVALFGDMHSPKAPERVAGVSLLSGWEAFSL